MQIRELERMLEVDLVERRPGDVVLTDVGAEVARRGERILAAERDLVDFARHRGRLLAGRLMLGVIPTVAPEHDGPRSMRRLNSDKSSSAKSRRAPDKSSSAKSACACSSPGKAPPECDVGLLGRVLNDPFLRNLSTHAIEERVDALMVALNCCAGPMHLKQARKDLQCQNRHEKTPQKRLRPRC